jgi:quercetin dioxygenase-like cupin family protein
MGKQTVLMRRNEGEMLSVMGAQLRFLCSADKTDKSWSMMEAVLPMDSGPPPHHHPWDEAYYVVSGEVRFGLGERNALLKAGDFIYAPAGTVHTFQGASKDPARLLIFDAPAHAEAFFRELGREVNEMPRDLSKVPGIGERHQVHFVDRQV